MVKIIEEVLITQNFDVHQDWENPIPGFFIIASKDTSKKSIIDFSEKELMELVEILCKVRRAMKEALAIENVQIYQSEKTDHGFHIWIFPRYQWMERFGEKVQSIRPIMEYAKENMMDDKTLEEVKVAARKVREAMV